MSQTEDSRQVVRLTLETFMHAFRASDSADVLAAPITASGHQCATCLQTRMSIAATLATGLVALLHVYFFVLESILWTKPLGLKTFRQNAERAAITAALAKNQGVYNLFLAAGLAWSLVAEPPFVLSLRLFFLGCVIVAAAVGAATVNRRIFLVQGVPALAALLCTVAIRAGT